MPTTIKAKSRLESVDKSRQKHTSFSTKTENSGKKSDLLKNYLFHLPTLLLSVIFYGTTLAVLTKINPETTKNLLFVNSYLLFQLPLFIGNFFFFSFLFLNAKRGILVSVLIFVFLFLKMQGVVL